VHLKLPLKIQKFSKESVVWQPTWESYAGYFWWKKPSFGSAFCDLFFKILFTLLSAMSKGYIRIHLLFLLCISCIINLAAAGAIKRKYPISARYDYEFCPALYLCPIPTAEETASNPNAEVEHWECIGRRLFAQPRTWRAPFEAHLVYACLRYFVPTKIPYRSKGIHLCLA
jgi:hypothetical protein